MNRSATGMKTILTTGLLALALAAGNALAQKTFEPERRGVGASRMALNAMERQPFDTSLWDKLSDWKNGDAPTAASTSGKVVLLVAYNDWYPPASRALRQVRKLLESRGKDGLMVVAAAHPEGFEAAKAPKPPEGATLLVGVDKESKLREALKVDQDPAFFVIDRAGQMRYAGIAGESVEEAVDTLLAESQNDAATLNERLAEAKRKADAEARRTAAIRQRISLATVPELPFTAGTPEDFEKAKWPELPKKENSNEEVKAKQMSLPETGWFPSKPPTNGRMYVLYFWHPKLPITYDRIMNQAELMQKQHQRDMVVVGVLTGITSINGQNSNDEEMKKYALTPEEAEKAIRDFRSARKLEHYLIADLEGTLLKSVESDNTIPVPYVAVLSSDQMARWWGWGGFSQFQGAIDRVLEVDPNVKARRTVEQQWLRERERQMPAAPTDASAAAPAESSAPAVPADKK